MREEEEEGKRKRKRRGRKKRKRRSMNEDQDENHACLVGKHCEGLVCPLFTSAFFSYCHGLISFFLSIVCPYSSILTIQFYLLRSCLSYNVSFFLCCTPSAIAHSQQDCRRDYNVSFQSTTNLLSCLQSLPLFPLILVVLFHIHFSL